MKIINYGKRLLKYPDKRKVHWKCKYALRVRFDPKVKDNILNLKI